MKMVEGMRGERGKEEKELERKREDDVEKSELSKCTYFTFLSQIVTAGIAVGRTL